MPYIFITVQSGGWDPSLPINLDYSPELDPEINGFLREHQQPNHKQTNHRGPSARNADGRGSVSTHCELRLILDGLEKLGFQLVTTASYSFQGRAHNEFIMHRELTPVMDHLHEMKHKEKQHLVVPEQNKKKNKDKSHNKQHRHRDRSSSSSSDHSMDDRNNRRKTDSSTPAHHKSKNHSSSSAPFHSQQSQLYY
ncbi:hypothetical protein DAPPUDRAFT_308862 [Daphnia pulex]|uniref:Uncharacterized protein n=1 Tax=Daphnia pulex TaxID=6669 RepID=E9H9N7_DAPPU|nr:hypothetical protein DAPPUDRAFT_308862 [Daphnia pulex]|eukprot:EFX71509.1 hypothetical protein DAPPUDRAFT_308862 [Daphnia pulex]